MLVYRPKVQSRYEIGVPYAHEPLFGTSGLAVSVDIGTTTVAIEVVDLATGQVTAVAGAFNHQMQFGDDVLTRINLCLVDPAETVRLQQALIDGTLLPLLAEAGVDPADIRGFVLSGNTTMLHLALGRNPGSLGFAPFTASFLDRQEVAASDLGLGRPDQRVVTLPNAGAYVGSDIVCGLLASGFLYDDGPALFVDVGTNGEIVYRDKDKMLGCATAAGPAFEGSGLSSGMRAGDGAVAHVFADETVPEFKIDTIGGGKPVGMCGSAYIDFLAESRRTGLLTGSGRLVTGGPWADRIVPHDCGWAALVAGGLGKKPIVVSEQDIARLLQAKAAIAAGIETLMRRAGVTADEVGTLYLAGGFGMHLSLANATGAGLLPGFRPEQIRLVGNTSLGGATLACIDRTVLPEMDRAARQIELVELNLDPDFEDTFLDNLCLP
jgi:uncharacterized 2Fe-2S/4Fe-4S cluster protein (DUF4445 family)